MIGGTESTISSTEGSPAPQMGARSRSFAAFVAVISVVSDGWSGKPSPLLHQLLLLPCLVLAAYLMSRVLRSRTHAYGLPSAASGAVDMWWWLAAFMGASALLGVLEARHFHQFGYHLGVFGTVGWLLAVLAAMALPKLIGPGAVGYAVFCAYAAGLLVSIRSFPLNYLRSDMLPVIGWADDRLLCGLGPYQTMHVGSRVYDFPYLPGVLVAFLPAAALRWDLRWADMAYMAALSILILRTSRPALRRPAAIALGLFLLCPFLQYRHDLYLQPHWFTLVLALALMQRRRFGWAALVWGVSCAVYQLSWVLLPFVVLNAFRRGGLREAGKVSLAAIIGFLAIAGPFLKTAGRQVRHNTISQWSRLPHALADPINLSYWVTYLVRPDHLMIVQAVVLTGLFAYCVAKKRCSDLEDTLRWMVWALALFISLNVLVDGYFYLTLLVLMLVYVCVAEGWWGNVTAPGPEGTSRPSHPQPLVERC